jgi:hypothetical protein
LASAAFSSPSASGSHSSASFAVAIQERSTVADLLDHTSREAYPRPEPEPADFPCLSDHYAGGTAKPRRRPGSILMTVAVITAGMGLFVAAFAAYLFGFTSLEAFHSQHRLAVQLVPLGTAGLAALNGRTPPAGQAVAILSIPTIGIRQVVVEGTSSKDLRRAQPEMS